MKDFTPTLINLLAGSTSTIEATVLGDKILFYVSLIITIGTTIFNFVLDCRRKWREQDKDNKKDEGGE